MNEINESTDILITGATGFIGAHATVELVKKFTKIKAIKRKTSSLEFISNVFKHYFNQPEKYFSRIKWIEADLTHVADVYDALADSDIVIHCAALVDFGEKNAKGIMDNNVIGTTNLLNACIEKKIKKFIYLSSIAVLKTLPGELTTEEDFLSNTTGISSYAKSKIFAERDVWRANAESLPVVVLYPSLVLGPGKSKSGSGRLINYVKNGKPFLLKGSNGFVYVRDIARAIMIILDKGIENEGFILSGTNLSYKELFSKTARQLNVKPPKYILNPWLVNMIIFFISPINKLFGKKLINLNILRSGSQNLQFENAKATSILNLDFTPVSEAIKDSIDFMKKHSR